MAKILGIDLGTSSIGLSLRDTEQGKNLKEQLIYFTSDIFQSGVGKSKSGEYSYAAERTKKRSPRRLFWSRKQRIWATLELLINNNMCPLSIEDLDKWRKYDKNCGYKREYPVSAKDFESWVRLDFDGDGVHDYSSPYQLRAELMKRQFNFNNQKDLYKLGRAIYHIAQRRGFRSSKGETISSQENDDIDVSDEMKKSELKASSEITKLMEEKELPTVGCAFAYLENQGIRVRDSQYKAVRSQYKDEIDKIFKFQEGLNDKTELLSQLMSEKKGEGTIFYKKTLKSQKGSVGKCTLEPSKPRCPISHPEFETFRAWSFINNIQYRKDTSSEWTSLSLRKKNELFDDVFLRVKSNFEFVDIRKWIEKNILNDGVKESITLEYSRESKSSTINYRDTTNVSGCPISAKLRNLLGPDWKTFKIKTEEERVDKKTGSVHSISYDATDIWHICATYDEPEFVEQFAAEKLKFDEKKVKQMVGLWGAIPQGYAMLSLKAITNINRFLTQGLIYSHAVMLAKLPDIMGENWAKNEVELINSIGDLISENRRIKEIYNIANSLIANYKSLDNDDKQGFKDPTYKLQNYDLRDVEIAIQKHYGEQKWDTKSEEEQGEIRDEVTKLYQKFFSSEERDYFKVPKLADMLADRIRTMMPSVSEKQLKKIYHPSMIEIYPMAKEQRIDGIWMKQLGSPVTGAIKNPMAMRVLHILKNHINSLIRTHVIDEDTKIVVETARDLCDSNTRAAIAAYQKQREDENKEILKILKEYNDKQNNGKSVTDLDVDRARLLLEQCELDELLIKEDYQDDSKFKKLKKEDKKIVERFKKDITKYKLWLEQGGICVYSNKRINIATLFADNMVDIEHTLPRSLSFDDSLSNKTICDSHYNRDVKKNRIPSQLPDYDKILQRIEPWKEKVNDLKEAIAQWKKRAKRATTKDRKDDCIQQYHMYEMELDYWEKKLNSFLVKDVNSGFRNSQLVDTRIITKYAFHYLKTVFSSVDVQKGSVTATFRKILGVQSIDEKKSRDKHSHHAIDATMLTLVPSSARREKMLKLFYLKEELKHSGMSTQQVENELNKEIQSCNVGDVRDVATFIEENILINHISKDQTLTPTSKRLRSRGKIVPLKDNEGNVIYEMDGDKFVLDQYGHKIPKAKRWIKGDTIRGQLHKDSIFGAIRYPQTDNNGKPIIKDGNFEYQDESNESCLMVMNIPINKFTGIKDFDKIIDPKVKECLTTVVTERMKGGLSFDKSIAEPIWLTDDQGKEIRQDKNGRPISCIRHIRCKVAAGRGFFTKGKAIEVREQTYKSKHPYKNVAYAQNEDNYLCLLYEGVKRGKVEREFRILNYMDFSRLRISVQDLWNESYFSSIENKGVDYKLTAIIKTGTSVLMWENSPDELYGLSNESLNKRLFVVRKFNFKGSNCIYLWNHLEAREESDIKEKDFTTYDEGVYQAKLTLVANSFNCLIEGRDFVKVNGMIEFKR